MNHDNRQPSSNEHSLSQLQDDYEEIGNQVKQIETHIKSLEQQINLTTRIANNYKGNLIALLDHYKPIYNSLLIDKIKVQNEISRIKK